MKKSGFFLFVVNRRSIVAVLSLMLCVCIIILSALFLPLDSIFSSAEVSDNIEYTEILLDAGHGGVDGGAVSPIDGTVEKNLNLNITLKAKYILKLMGYNVTLTRESDVSIHDESAKTIRQKKVSDLKNRLAILENGKYDMLVSVHMNIFSQGKYSGTQVFYGGKNENSKVLANFIQGSVKKYLQKDNKRVVKKSTKSIYLLYNATKPAIMAECGFLSNEDELAKLKTEKYQRQMAICIANGVNEYSRITEKTKG